MVLTNDMLLNDDILDVDYEYSYVPNVVGIAIEKKDSKRKYIVYNTNERGRIDWKEEIDTFKEAILFARKMYRGMIGSIMRYSHEKENIVEKLIGKNKEYVTVSPSLHNRGHGGNLSVKVVIPTYCQAHCKFCFNNLTKDTQTHNCDEFFRNLTNSLDMILDNITERKITIDITGNEPTFDVNTFRLFMDYLRTYKDKLCRVILTTNGFNLDKCIDSMVGVVDIVNISVHHYDYSKRQEIFGTKLIPSDEKLREMVQTLSSNGIKCTATAVLFEKIDFMDFYTRFVSWAKSIGFKDSRMRSNFCKDDDFIEDILNMEFPNQIIDRLDALTTKIIYDDENDFEVRILKGVEDLTEYLLGAEVVIDDDGLCYIDYNKRYPVDSSNIEYFNNFYAYKSDETLEKCKRK